MDGGSERGLSQGREGKRGRWIDYKQRGTDCGVMAKSGLNQKYQKRAHNTVLDCKENISEAFCGIEDIG